MKAGDRIIREKEAALITGLGRTTRWKMEREGHFPVRVKLTATAYGWKLSDITAWIDSLGAAVLDTTPNKSATRLDNPVHGCVK